MWSKYLIGQDHRPSDPWKSVAGFFVILAGPAGPGPYSPGPNNLEEYSKSNMVRDYNTAPEAYLLHASGAVYISNMILEHIWLINGPGPYGPGAAGPGP